jgi:UTP--glucose-1-phosphate uridylyltransferase
MKVRKAVITAAGSAQRSLPLQTLVDRDGATKTALTITIEEALGAGVEELCVVVHPGDVASYQAAAGPHGRRVKFIEQTEARGYGHAVWSAKPFTRDEPFLLLVGDHLYLSSESRRCARQLVEVAEAENCAVSAVQATHESKLPFYGAAGGRLADHRKGLYLISEVMEKPTPTVAEQHLIVPGLRAGYYLCFFGMHVLTSAVMATLDADLKSGGKGQLSSALMKLASRERYLAAELQGRRFDIGHQYGLLHAQLAIALSGSDRSEVLSSLVELLAQEAR